MLSPEIVTFLEGGCALIIGAVAPDGEPHATRGWGLTVLPGDGSRLRLLLPSDDDTAIELLAAGGRIAITGADVSTLRAMQLKGRSLGIEPATDADRARGREYTEAFFADIETADRYDRPQLHRFEPSGYVACLVVVDDLYDQTPGPGAGAALLRGEP